MEVSMMPIRFVSIHFHSFLIKLLAFWFYIMRPLSGLWGVQLTVPRPSRDLQYRLIVWGAWNPIWFGPKRFALPSVNLPLRTLS